jgi:hypothetical protein
MRGIDTMPAPSRPRLLEERVDELVRADRPDRAVGTLAAVVARDALDPVDAAGGVATLGAADPSGEGAVPHTSQ